VTVQDEVTDLITKCRLAFAELEKTHRTIENEYRQYFDTVGSIKTNSGGLVERCDRLQQEIDRLTLERDAVAEEFRKRKMLTEADLGVFYESRMQDVTRQIEQEASERRKVLGQLTSEIAVATAQLNAITQSVRDAEKARMTALAGIDTEMVKAQKRLTEAQSLADKATKDYEQRLQYLDSRGSQREAEQKLRVAALDAEIKKAEDRLEAVKQAARAVLATMGG